MAPLNPSLSRPTGAGTVATADPAISPISAIVEVFVGGLHPSATEACLRSTLGPLGLLPCLNSVRVQMATEEEEEEEEGGGRVLAGGEASSSMRTGGRCLGVAHLGFSSRHAAEVACGLVKEVSKGESST